MLTTAQWKKRIENGETDAALAMLYGAEDVLVQRQRRLDLIADFEAIYGEREAVFVSAPGRSEIGGNHTDHQGGHVLAAATSMDMICLASPSNDQLVELHSDGFAPIRIQLDSLQPRKQERGRSSALVRGMLARMKSLGVAVRGLHGVVTSSVPRGSGISSSAAYSVLIGSVVEHLFAKDSVGPVEIAKAAKFSENNYFGKPSGLLDQLACACGGFTMLDFSDAENPKIDHIDCDFSKMGLRVFIQNTGGSHASLTDEYASIPEEMRTVASYFDKRLLSEVDAGAFYTALPTLRGSVSDRALLRSMHYFSEDARVPQEAEALRAGDAERFCSLVRASGKSSFELLQNVCPTDAKERSLSFALAAAERLLNGNGAVRVHGGGFAGTIQAFVPEDRAETFKREMETLFGNDTCYSLRIRPVGAFALPEK